MMSSSDTIYALSSGRPPAAIAVIRISGSDASTSLMALAGRIPPPRRATLADLQDENGALLDRALLLWFPGPSSATGEDLAELHLHGGRAVVEAVQSALRQKGMREAVAGEFTRRAFENGRVDLAEAEGLADLLLAETETQRRHALDGATGRTTRQLDGWRNALLDIAAQVEARIDFSDEGEVADWLPAETFDQVRSVWAEVTSALAYPSMERLRDGFRVVVAGPPNAGKSSLVNALADRDVAIVAEVPGTTRDVIEVPLSIDGMPFLLLDTAGIRETDDRIETAGVQRTQSAMLSGDIILWLGAEEDAPPGAVWVVSKADLLPVPDGGSAQIRVSAVTGEGLAQLMATLSAKSTGLLPREGEVAFNKRQRSCLRNIENALGAIQADQEVEIVAEHLRSALAEIDRFVGRAGVENMLDALFQQLCIGK